MKIKSVLFLEAFLMIAFTLQAKPQFGKAVLFNEN